MQKNNKRLLIVDDDKQIRELLVFDIAQSGYIVDCAEENDVILLKGSRGIALERIIPLVADSEAKNE